MRPLSRDEQRLVESALEPVRRYARVAAKRMRIHPDDAVAVAHAQLVVAATRFEPSLGVPFLGFAFPGVAGALADFAAKERASRAWRLVGAILRAERSGLGAESAADESLELTVEPGPAPRELVVDSVRRRLAGMIAAAASERLETGGDEQELVRLLDRAKIRAVLDRVTSALSDEEQVVLRCLHQEGLTLAATTARLETRSQRTVQRIDMAVRQKLAVELRAAGVEGV